MTYKVSLENHEITFIKACVLGTARRSEQQMKASDAVKVVNAATEVITNLNQARLTHLDVRFINVSIEKTKEYLKTDTYLTEQQRAEAIATGTIVQNKLAGVGAKRAIEDA